MGQQKSCQSYVKTQNWDADSAYGSTTDSNLCDDNNEEYFTSSDDSLVDEPYDADDEIEKVTGGRPEGTGYKISESCPDYSTSPPDSDQLFCFNRSYGHNTVSFLDIIKNRAKLSERMYTEDDSDSAESEYEVIDTDNEDSGLEGHKGRIPSKVKPIITFRHYGSHDDGIVEILATYTKKRLCKVKSLPNLRFPLRKKSNACKTTSLHLVSIDHNNFRNASLTSCCSTDSQDLYSPKPNRFSYVRKGRNIVDDYDKKAKKGCNDVKKRCHDVKRRIHYFSECVGVVKVVNDDSRLGTFQICHMVENPL